MRTRIERPEWKVKPLPVWMKRLGSRGALVLWFVALMAAGVALLSTLYSVTLTERSYLDLSPTSIIAAQPGPAMFVGEVQRSSTEEALSSPFTDTECVAFRATVESQDGRRWQTISDVHELRNFTLRDVSGEIDTALGGMISRLEADTQTESDGHRYTEYLLQEGDQAILFGEVEIRGADDRLVVSSPRGTWAGTLTALVSNQTIVAPSRSMKGGVSGILIWILVVLGLAGMICAKLLGVRRMLSLLVVVCWVQVGAVIVATGLMVSAEVTSIREQTLEQQAGLLERIENLFADDNISWAGEWESLEAAVDDAPVGTQATINALYAEASRQVSHYNDRLNQFPGATLSRLLGNHPLPTLGVSPDVLRANPVSSMDLAEVRRVVPLAAMYLLLSLLVLRGAAIPLFRSARRFHYMEHLPPSGSAGLTYGLANITGQARAISDGIVEPLTQTPCLGYVHTIYEGTDPNHKCTHREQVTPAFYCASGDRQILVVPEGADFELTSTTEIHQDGPHTHRLQFIKDGDPLYIVGMADISPLNPTQLAIQAAPEAAAFPFVVSDRTDAVLRDASARRDFAYGVLIIAATALLGRVVENLGSSSPAQFIWCAALPLVFAIVATWLLASRDFAFSKEQIDGAWGAIEESLGKRAAVVDRLQTVIAPYVKGAPSLAASLAALKTHATAKHHTPGEAAAMTHVEADVHRGLVQLVDDHPVLRASPEIWELFEELVALRYEVALIGAGYNRAVETYNTRQMLIPEVGVAALKRLSKAAFFNVNDEDTTLPKID